MGELPQREILLSGRRVTFGLRRNPRARRVLLKVEDEAGLVVVLPRWFAARDAPALVEKHAPWVLRALARREARLRSLSPPPGAPRSALFRGDLVPLRFVPEPGRFPPLVRLEEGHLVLRAPPPEPEGSQLHALLHAWYRAQARLDYPVRVERWAATTGLRPRRLHIGDSRTRWGSCTSKGSLSLSWRLVLAPEEVLDYLVVHELCHLRHPDHSPAFWNLVGAHLPGYTRPREWLRKHGAALRAPA